MFFIFFFHLLSRDKKSYLYVKLWKNLHSYIDYCSLGYFNTCSVPHLEMHHHFRPRLLLSHFSRVRLCETR